MSRAHSTKFKSPEPTDVRDICIPTLQLIILYDKIARNTFLLLVLSYYFTFLIKEQYICDITVPKKTV